MLKRSDMHEYQNRTVDFIKENRKVSLMLFLGAGKTISSLTAISDLTENFEVDKTLIIAPLRVANSVWKQETENWEHLKSLTVAVCTGTESVRKNALNSDADIYVINRENIPWLVKLYAKKWKWDAIIIDESSSFKSAKSRRFKALKKVTKFANFIIELTGTPTPNGIKDIWAQIFLLDNGERLGRTMTAFTSTYFQKTGYMGYELKLLAGSEEKIRHKIRDLAISMEAKDYLELPKRLNIFERIDLPDYVLSQYKSLEKEFLITINQKNIDAVSAATLGNKLLQICNGAIYDEDKNWHLIHDEKIKALKEIVEDNLGENLLVAYNYKSDLERLIEAFPTARILDKNPETITQWNAGEISMLLTQPAGSAMGINLQRGGATVVWFGLNWSLELYQQFNARVDRQGQKNTVKIIHLIANGKMDEKVVKALTSKAKTQQDLLDYLKI